jgi:hypothetical protein
VYSASAALSRAVRHAPTSHELWVWVGSAATPLPLNRDPPPMTRPLRPFTQGDEEPRVVGD